MSMLYYLDRLTLTWDCMRMLHCSGIALINSFYFVAQMDKSCPTGSPTPTLTLQFPISPTLQLPQARIPTQHFRRRADSTPALMASAVALTATTCVPNAKPGKNWFAVHRVVHKLRQAWLGLFFRTKFTTPPCFWIRSRFALNFLPCPLVARECDLWINPLKLRKLTSQKSHELGLRWAVFCSRDRHAAKCSKYVQVLQFGGELDKLHKFTS